MHISKIEYFQSKYPEKDCLYGITRSSIDSFSVGTPCIAWVNPFIKNKGKNSWRGRLSGGFESFSEDLFSFNHPTKKTNHATKKPTKKKVNNQTSAIDLYDVSVDEANNIIESSRPKTKLIFMQNIYSGDHDFYTTDVMPTAFHFDGSKPLIYDSCLRVDSDSLSDMHKDHDISDIGDIMMSLLLEYRYINYSVRNVAKSNAEDVYKYISKMVRFLGHRLPENVCFYRSDSGCRSLIDTVSISFYKLSDVIAIFDSKRAVGLCMEIFLTSSVLKDPTYPRKNMTFRFLFCKHRDNAFTVDGDKIIRPSDIPTLEGIKYMQNGLYTNVANDSAIKAKKAEIAQVNKGG